VYFLLRFISSSLLSTRIPAWVVVEVVVIADQRGPPTTFFLI
jgi:hypothetical protein